eukprot:12194655-Ditylum_brightwellii.AAC.1
MACDKFDVQSNGVRVEVGKEFVMTLAISLKGVHWRMQFVNNCIKVWVSSKEEKKVSIAECKDWADVNQNTSWYGRTMLASSTYAMVEEALVLILVPKQAHWIL